MSIIFEALYAREGDCLLLHHGADDKPRHIIIDGGVASTFNESLKKRLEQLEEEHPRPEGQSLPIELLVVTHIDKDHLDGVVKMAEHLVKLREDKPWDIKGLWFNSFDDVVGNDTCAKIASLGASAPEEVVAIMASVRKGQELRDLAKELYISVNQPYKKFPSGLVARPSDGPVTERFGDLKLTVLCPDAAALKAQEKQWDAYLKAHPEAAAEGRTAGITQDTSVPNLSSIVLLAEAQRKRLLLTGDANAEEILAGLTAAGLLKDGEPFEVDLLKVQHHGSNHNSTKEFYEKVRAKHYVISANGEYGNPDRETLDMLWAARGEEDGWDLYLTIRRNEFELVKGTTDKDEKRRKELKQIQAWLNKHKPNVIYRQEGELGVRIDLSAEHA